MLMMRKLGVGVCSIGVRCFIALVIKVTLCFYCVIFPDSVGIHLFITCAALAWNLKPYFLISARIMWVTGKGSPRSGDQEISFKVTLR